MIRNLGGDALGENPKRFTLGFNKQTGHQDPEGSMVCDSAVLIMNIAMK